MLPPRHILDVDDLARGEIDALMDHAKRMKFGEQPSKHAGRVIGLLFGEPSVRTRFGFSVAAARLGVAAIDMPLPYLQSAMSARESWADWALSIGNYPDVIVARCSSSETFEAVVAHSAVPVVNAGSGRDAHPTQALIDLFAMDARFGRIDGLRIGIMGDLSSSRCAKSLMRLLARYAPAEVRLMHPGEPRSLLSELQLKSPAGPSGRWRDLGARRDLSSLDVVYMAGFPAGPADLKQDAERIRLRRELSVDRAAAEVLPSSAIILCPMPRVDEIGHDLDDHPTMGMFCQSREGLYVRMAVMHHVLRNRGAVAL